MGERSTPDGFWDRQKTTPASGPTLEEQERLRACNPTGGEAIPSDQWVQDGKVWDDAHVPPSSNLVSLPPMDSDEAAPILEAMERAIRDMAPVTPLVGAQFAYEAIRSFMPEHPETTAPYQWIEGQPTAPGWYVVHYASDRYEAIHLLPLSNLLRFPNPENYGIQRHFAFAVTPEKTSARQTCEQSGETCRVERGGEQCTDCGYAPNSAPPDTISRNPEPSTGSSGGADPFSDRPEEFA